MKQVYTSGRLPKTSQRRGFVARKAYVFEIRTGHTDGSMLTWHGDKIVIQLHSSQTSRWTSDRGASTEIYLNRNEAGELLAGLLAALNHEGAST